MNRLFAIAVAASLALPLVALGALIGEQEAKLASAAVLNVPLRGYDPRDLLRGHYMLGRLDWDWEREPAPAKDAFDVDGAACVLAADGPKPRLRFVAAWQSGDRADDDCRLMIVGRGWPRQGSTPARFVPASLDDGNGNVKLFVPEARATDLENLLMRRPGALTVDLAVRPDGSAAIKALRVDGQPISR